MSLSDRNIKLAAELPVLLHFPCNLGWSVVSYSDVQNVHHIPSTERVCLGETLLNLG